MGRQEASPEKGWQNDAAAFARVVRRWQQPVARFLMRIIGDADRIQDASQEVFLRVFQARHRYCEKDAFSTWLFQIALNVARDGLRRNRHWQPLPNHDSLSDDSHSLEAEQRETLETIAAAVAELPTHLREVIALRHDQDMSFEQMARVLNKPVSTLKSRFSVALNRLRQRLAQLGPSLEEK